MDVYRVYINAGHLAVDNGNKNGITMMLDLAKLLDTHLNQGGYWGSDYIEVEKDQLDILIELLQDTKLPYKILQHPEGDDWKNLFTDVAKQHCRVPADYSPKYNRLHFSIVNTKRIPE